MAFGRFGASLPTPRFLLGTSALADIAVRMPEDIVAPLVSLTGGFLGNPAVGFGTTWIMFGIALFLFAHLPYSHVDIDSRKETGFRVVFALSAVLLGITLQQAERPSILLAVGLPGVFVSGGLLLAYLVQVHGWTLSDPQGQAVGVLESIAPHENVTSELESDFAYEGCLGYLAAGVFILAVTVVLGFPIAIAAIVVQVLIYAFPVPDVVFLGWAVSVRLVPSVSVGPDQNRITDFEFDFERFLYDRTEYATRSLQGLFATVFTMLGLLLSAGYLLLAAPLASEVVDMVGITFGAIQSGHPIQFAEMFLVWNWIGTVVLLLTAGNLGLWVWVRELHRLPHFLDRWENRQTSTDAQPVTRVTGFVSVPVVGWAISIIFISHNDVFDPFSNPLLPSVYALLWPAVVGIGVWVVKHTYRRESQSVANEYRWIVAGLIIQTVSLWIGTDSNRFVNALFGKASLISVAGPAVMVTALLLFVSVIPLAGRYEQRHEDIRRYTLVGVLLGLGTLVAGSVVVVPERYRLFAYALLAVCWGFGTLLGIVRYYRL